MSGEATSPGPVASTDDRREWVEFVHFHIGEHSYLFELGRVERIVRNPSVTPVPRASSAIAGVANLGGAMPVIVDGRSLLDLPAQSGEADSILLLLDRESARPTGLLVDAVAGIDAHHVDRIDPPAVLDEWDLPLGRRWFRAVVSEPDQNQQTGVFDLDVLVTEAREKS